MVSSRISDPVGDLTFDSSASTKTSSKVVIFGVIGFLLMTAALALLWSRSKLIWLDESMVLWTDSASTVSQVVEIQRFYPLSLDPVLYHLTAHACIQALGPTVLALRVPALVGFLIMQGCLFVFVERIAGRAAGFIAMGFPTLPPAFTYAIDGRPYGLMLGFMGIAMVSWQSSVRNPSRRSAALIALALGIAGALNTHYFGVLVLVPLCAAEAWRTLQRRRFDFPVLCAIAVGSAGIIFILPFIRSAAEFKAHIFDPVTIGQWNRILGAYSVLIPIGYPRFQQLGAIFFAAIVCLSIYLLKHRRKLASEPELLFIILLATLPLPAFGIAIFVTHNLESRHTVGALMGVAAMAGIALGPMITRTRPVALCVISMVVLTCSVVSMRIVHEERRARDEMSTLTTSSAVDAYLRRNPNAKIYIQGLHFFAFATYYEPEPEIRSRIALLFSRETELRLRGFDTSAITAIHMKRFTSFSVEDWQSLMAQRGAHLIYVPDPRRPPIDDWIGNAIKDSHIRIDSVGPAFDGVAVRLQP